MKLPSQAYRDAIDDLRRFTLSPAGSSPMALLVRVTALSPAAAAALVKLPLRTKQDRRDAIVMAAFSIATEDRAQ